jgi:hypothetical protein
LRALQVPSGQAQTQELSRAFGIERQTRRTVMGFGRGFLLWILGIPLPIILLLALFWR